MRCDHACIVHHRLYQTIANKLKNVMVCPLSTSISSAITLDVSRCVNHIVCATRVRNIEVQVYMYYHVVHGKSIIVCTQVFQFYSPKNNGRSSPSITSIRMKSLAQSCIFFINLQCSYYNVRNTMQIADQVINIQFPHT